MEQEALLRECEEALTGAVQGDKDERAAKRCKRAAPVEHDGAASRLAAEHIVMGLDARVNLGTASTAVAAAAAAAAAASTQTALSAAAAVAAADSSSGDQLVHVLCQSPAHSSPR
jgi:hypothetical protein